MVPVSLLACLLVLAAAPPDRAAQDAPAEAPHRLLERVAAIGARLTAGVRTPASLARVFEATLAEERRVAFERTDVTFFQAPRRNGQRLVAQALEVEPTMVLAVDFLFWFGYGSAAADGKPMRGEADRLALLEEGLRLLEAFPCPVVVSDFPDMSISVGAELRPEQMPRAETLVQLNARLREWAAEREGVVVLPLAQLIDDMRCLRPFQIGERRWEPGSGARLLQNDLLHPNLEGLAALAQLIAVELGKRPGWTAPGAFEMDPGVVLARLDSAKGQDTGGRRAGARGRE
jgi:hypothetical protein